MQNYYFTKLGVRKIQSDVNPCHVIWAKRYLSDLKNRIMGKNKMKMSSACVRDLKDPRSTAPHQLPIYATSSFRMETLDQAIGIFSGKDEGHTYSRYRNPTVDMVAQKIANLEAFDLDLEADAILTSSGMAAISTLLLACLKPGDQLLTQGNLYGGSTEFIKKIMSKFGVEPIWTDLRNQNKAEEIFKSHPNIRMVYLETPANPTLACVDLKALSDLAKKYGALTAVDNTFCTPLAQQPFKHGIDFVIHSTTKFLNGHGNSISGIIIGRKGEIKSSKIWETMKLAGTNCSPFEAWLVNNGLKTLALRMERHSSNAQKLAEYLDQHSKVNHVNYTGLPHHQDHAVAIKQMKLHGAMLSFEVDGGLESAKSFMNRLKFCTMAPTLGDVDTLVLHPATSSHMNVERAICEEYGISEGLVRISVGIEDIQDIIDDVEQALG